MLNPPGLRFESLLALKLPPRPPQEASKTSQRGFQEAKKLQEAYKETFGTYLASNLDPIWKQNTSSHECFESSRGAPPRRLKELQDVGSQEEGQSS